MRRARRVLGARAYGRCTMCGRLTEKSSLRIGPGGGKVGPVCFEKWQKFTQEGGDDLEGFGAGAEDGNGSRA